VKFSLLYFNNDINLFSHDAVEASRFLVICSPTYVYISILCYSFKLSLYPLNSHIIGTARVTVQVYDVNEDHSHSYLRY